MEEEIYDIIQKHYDSLREEGIDGAKKEISTMMMEFINWLEFGSHQFYPDPQIDGHKNFYNAEDHTIYSVEDIFDYWLKNIKDVTVRSDK
jgi:hypothetical protein